MLFFPFQKIYENIIKKTEKTKKKYLKWGELKKENKMLEMKMERVGSNGYIHVYYIIQYSAYTYVHSYKQKHLDNKR